MPIAGDMGLARARYSLHSELMSCLLRPGFGKARLGKAAR